MTGDRLDALTLITDPALDDTVYAERLGRSRRAALELLAQLTGRRLIERQTGSGGPIDFTLPAGFRALRLVGRIATTGETNGLVIVRLSADGGSSFRTTAYDYSGFAGVTDAVTDFHLRPGAPGDNDASAFFPYVLTTSGFDHALDLHLIDYEPADQRTKVAWDYVEDRGSNGRATHAIGWVNANEAHDALRVTRTAGALGAYDLALIGYL